MNKTINPKELRVGNLVLGINNSISIVERLSSPFQCSKSDWEIVGVSYSMRFKLKPSRMINAKPIELTEDWVERFGFKKWKGKSIWTKGKFLIYHVHGVGFCYGKSHFRTELPSVHNIQNLYFFLTNKELTYE